MRVGQEENQKEAETGEQRVSKALKAARLQQSGTAGGKDGWALYTTCIRKVLT